MKQISIVPRLMRKEKKSFTWGRMPMVNADAVCWSLAYEAPDGKAYFTRTIITGFEMWYAKNARQIAASRVKEARRGFFEFIHKNNKVDHD